MNARAAHALPSADAAEFVRRLGVILAGLAALVAARFLRNRRLVGLILPLWHRLTHVAGRVERSMAQPTRGRAIRGQRSTRTRPPGAQLPQGRGWLVRELGYEAVGFGLQLEHLLNEPAMQAALMAVPAAGLVIRPICRMLGVEQPPARTEVAVPPQKTPPNTEQTTADHAAVIPPSNSYLVFAAQAPPSRPAATTDPPQRAKRALGE